MDTIKLWIRYFCLLICVAVVKAGESCYMYYTYGSLYNAYCSYKCCGSYAYYRYCCYYSYAYYYSLYYYYYSSYNYSSSAVTSVGLIVGAVIGGIVGLIVLVVIIICIASACQSSSSRGTVVRPVNSNPQTVAVISNNQQTFGHPQPHPPQPQPYGYQPQTYPNPAYGNPAYPPANPPPYDPTPLPNQPNVFSNAAANASSSSKPNP